MDRSLHIDNIVCPTCNLCVSFHIRMAGPQHKAFCTDCGAPYLFVSTKKIEHFEMPFGKWKGKPLDEIPREYLEWAAENFSQENIRERICHFLENA